MIKFLKAFVLLALSILLLDKLAGRLLYFLDPEFRKYIEKKSVGDKTSAGESTLALIRHNGHLTERISNA